MGGEVAPPEAHLCVRVQASVENVRLQRIRLYARLYFRDPTAYLCVHLPACEPKEKRRKERDSSLWMDWLPSLSPSLCLSILPPQLKPLFTAPVALSS